MATQRFFRYLLIAVLSLSFLTCPNWVNAQSETGYDLVAAVNVLREAHGLEPYTVDPWIMDYAQQHSQYQADIQTSTHGHSDGTNSLAAGLRENVAGGDNGYVTISMVVYEIWADPVHMNTMIGYKTGQAGAGVAVDSNDTVYFTLNVRPGGTAQQAAGTSIPPSDTSQPVAPFVPIVTSTPAENGNIIHIVELGETLWGIAVSYGVTMDDIRSPNGLRSDEITIYVGQKLFIRQVMTTNTPTQAETTSIITATPSIPTLLPSKTPSLIPSITPTQATVEQRINGTGGNMLILGFGLGATVVGTSFGIFTLLKKRK